MSFLPGGFIRLGGGHPPGGGPPAPTNYELLVAALIANGGWFWDFTRADALFQDSAATIPVSALDNPVGMTLSVDRGLALGSPLSPVSTNLTGSAVDNGNGTYSIGSATGFIRFFFDLAQLVQGATYQIDFATLNVSGGNLLVDFCDEAAITVVPGQSGAFTCKGRRTTYDSTYRFVDLWVNGTNATVLCSAPTLRQVSGTSLIQATSANRPLFKQGAGALFDGSNDGLASASAIDLSGTNKIMLIAGVRKLSDAAFGMLTEHSATVSSNNGSFYLAAPLNNSGTRFRWLSKGTTQQVVDLTAAGYAAPVSAVVTSLGDIGGNIARVFINGTQVAENTSTQGTGSYGNYTFYVGRRGGASNPYNGYLTGLCLVPYIDNDLKALAETVIGQLNQGLPS